MPTLLPFPKLYVDPTMPGYVRFVKDPSAGFLVGMRAREVAMRLNTHDELFAALQRYLDCDQSRDNRGDTPANQARAALAKVLP